MSAQTITIIRGVVLIAVFGLAGWGAKRRRRLDQGEGP